VAAVRFAKTLTKLVGWKRIGTFSDAKKLVIIAAPHTSLVDFIMGWLGLHGFGKKARFIIKEEFFFFPLGFLIRGLGAIPVKRGDRNNDMVTQMVKEFQKRDSFYLVITPEGTRKKVKRWKKGFYEIAMKAGVPIVVSVVDYGKKQMGPVAEIIPSGDYEADLKIIKEYYRGVQARFPEEFSIE
jgi:1-acyl-sn-glycerol-3-phosphate acyltransferase